jgi:DNA polymerase phi
LFRAADKSLKTLVSTVEALPELLPAVLPRLISGHGVYNFDRLTKTKTVERLLTTVHAKNVEATLDALIKPVKNIPE